MLHSSAPLPSFEGATSWASGPVDSDRLRGRPVLVYFWALSCHLCEEHVPELAAFRARYGPRGLQMISVHMPRQESDLDVDRVTRVARERGIVEPLAIDNAHALGDRFETEGMWPAYFLFDAEGKLRSRATGAASLSVLEPAARRVLPEAA